MALVFTNQRNLNRGYMKLEVWNDSVELSAIVHEIVSGVSGLDLRLKGQLLDAAQSVSANVAEGYCRKTINEYLYFLNVSLGSMGELMTRMIGLRCAHRLTDSSFDTFDRCHYEVENKLLALKKSLQVKRREGSWETEIREAQRTFVS